MNWTTKARIQNAVAFLPSGISHAIYYQLQRRFGGLREIDPVAGISTGVEICRMAARAGRTQWRSRVLEIGTGRRLNVPITLWLAGAEQIVTVDLHPYLKESLVRRDIEYIVEHPEQIARLFGPLLDEARFAALLDLAERDWRLDGLLRLCRIDYRPRADASSLDLPDRSIDLHLSCSVLEHIPVDHLKGILREGNRTAARHGLFVHLVDYSDHFSHSDTSISPVNFLRFSDREWERIAGNRYMYANRLRVDDMLALFHACGHNIVIDQPDIDVTILDALTSPGFRLDPRFLNKPHDVLATRASWIVSEPE